MSREEFIAWCNTVHNSKGNDIMNLYVEMVDLDEDCDQLGWGTDKDIRLKDFIYWLMSGYENSQL